jgi:hypothetical protein
VVFDDGFLGFVNRSYYNFIEDETAVTSTNQDRRTAPRKMSRLSDSSSENNHLPSVSDRIELSLVDDSTVEYGHDSIMTPEVLLHLLAKSIAKMQLDDAHIAEWMNQLCDRIKNLC